MSCPSCGHENPADANFCGQCGEPLPSERTCPECGRSNPAELRFCRGCGVALSEAPAGAANGSGGNGAHANAAAALPPPAPPDPSAAESPSAGDGEAEGAGDGAVDAGRIAGGRYAIGKFLGEGGRKRVYRGHDAVLDRDVAVAIVKTEGLDAEGRTRVRREAQAMARLGDHPHVVTVFDIGEEDGEPYIVSQYMSGGALEGLLEQAPDGRLDLATTLRIATAICRALEHAHRYGIVHRDLKPANVWLSEDGTAKLGDFGLAYSLERSRVTRTGMIVGTVAYMAPEQALGRQPDAASDLYSLGALMYEMVTGRPPFSGDDVISVISQHQNADPVAPSWRGADVPQELEKLILDLLAKQPADRPSASQALARLAAVPRAAGPTRPALRASEDANPVEALAEGVFVGREREFDRLRSGLEDALQGRGRLLVLVGEPGIGKTRTAQELATYARLRGARVLVGRSYEGEGAPAYWPWLQIGRAYIQERDPAAVAREMGAGAADIAQVMSELTDLIPGLRQPETLEPEQARFRFFDSITAFLKNASHERPLVLVLDDLHWADTPSIRLLQFLAREIGDAPLLVVGTYRDVELARRHPLSDALADLGRAGLVERVPLHGLTEAEVARLIEATASIEPPPALVRAVHQETEGNPFFVSEIVNLLASEGILEDPNAAASWTVTIPQGVREVVGRRLDRLSEDCNALLATASAVGREFGVEVLERVAEMPRDRVLELLDEAEAARVVDEAARGPALRFSFSHALIRETLYEELGVTRRVRLHRRIAEVIEELCGTDREPHLEELAHHFLEAQELGRAIEYSVDAADRAVRVMAYEEAAHLYGQALDALDVHDPRAARRRCELTLATARSQSRAGDVVRSKETFDRAARLARELDDGELLAAAAEGRAKWVEIGIVDEQLIDLLEDALARLPGEDSTVRARLLSRLAVAVHFRSRERRVALARDAITMARRLADPAALASVLNSSQFALRGPDNLDYRLAVDRELIVAAERAGDRELAVEGRGLHVGDLLEAGDIEAARSELRAYEEGAKTLRQPIYLRYALLRRGMLATLEGRFDDADGLLEEVESPALNRSAGDPNAVQGIGVARFWLRRHQGRVDDIVQGPNRFAEQYPTVPAWRGGVAMLHLERGELEDAQRELDRMAAGGFEQLPRDANWLIGMTLIAEVAAALGDRERARLLYDELLPYERRVIVVGAGWACNGSAARYLGSLAGMLDRYADADRHFEAALERNAAIGGRPFVALTSYDYARVLCDRGDRRRANELVGSALDIGGELGMRTLVDRALALRLRIQGVDRVDVRTSIDAVASAVEDERPDLGAHTAPDGTVTILFSDIERSTELNERLGDRRWLELLREHNGTVRAELRRHGGFEVKSQGDGFMVAFASAARALQCAVSIQRALDARAALGRGEAIRVRMGLHTGEAIRERDDFFGRNVVLAARIAAEARGGEVLVSGRLKDLTDGGADVAFGEARELPLKGLTGRHRVHAVEWRAPAPAAAGA